jgi:sulfatase-like protein
MRRLQLWYPFLFSVLPLLNILTRNPGGSRLADIGVVTGTLLLGCALLYLLVGLALGGRWSNPIIPPIVLAAIVWGNAKSTLGGWAWRLGGGAATFGLILVLLAITILGLWWLARRPRHLDRANTFFALTGSLMVAWLGFRFVLDELHARSTVRHSVLARQLAQPVRSKTPLRATASGPQRDIYLIVLDEYANAGVLQDRFRFDNRVFEDSLKRLGFTIPALVRSNYVHTLLSLPSLLNFSHLTSLTAEVGIRSADATLPNYLLENNRTVAFLKSRGYQFLFFPSWWWPSTNHSPNADWEFEAWNGFDLGREATRSDLRRSFIRSTALGLLMADDSWDAEHLKRTLAGLEQVPERSQPTFTFAHILSPHWPYVLGANCEVVSGRRTVQPSSKDQRYIDQLQCLNRMLLRVVSTLLERSSVPPIILLQGDHGTNSLRYSKAKTAQAVSPAQAQERFGAFGAYYLPEGGDRGFTDTVTIVNVLQKVLTHYLDAEIPPAPDELYVSLERTPYDLVPVNPMKLSSFVSSTRSPGAEDAKR